MTLLPLVETMPQITAAGLSELHNLIDALDRSPTAANYVRTSREIGAFDGHLAPVRVALLSSFTIDLLQPYLQVELARHRLAARLYVAPFNTVHQELLDPQSGCAAHAPDVVFVARQVADVCPPLAHDFLSLRNDEVERCLSDIVRGSVEAVEAFRTRSNAAVVFHLFTMPPHPLLGIGEATARASQTTAIRELNARLTEALEPVAGAYVLDAERVAAAIGYRHYYDNRLWHLARAPLSGEALRELARVQAATTQAVLGRQAKCLVLDLDGTLWGGVVGELGAEGIQLGERYPGSAYLDFQRAALALHQRGVLLAINSKNNPNDVDAVFDRHPHTVLRREHFAAVRINWQDKPQNMRAIAAELNIGLDAIVFVDDNPAERALMRQSLPEVRTLDWPQDPLRYCQTLSDSHCFDRFAVSEEDRRRGHIVQAEAERRSWRESMPTVEDFLESLQMEAAIEPASPATMPRVLDLVQKTNQFNLTTRRHSAAELARMAADARHGIFTMRLRDRFGDEGIVGVAILSLQGEIAILDTLLLSCRVIGRNAETTLLSHVSQWARERGAVAVEGVFVPTAKNAPARDFFPRHGFEEAGREGEAVHWRVPVAAVAGSGPAYIACTTHWSMK